MEILLGIIIFYITFFIALYYIPFNLWITAIFSGVWISLFRIIKMRAAKVQPRIIMEALITARKAGIKIPVHKLEEHYQAGGHVPSVVQALVSAKNNGYTFNIEEATRIDLAVFDVFHIVMLSTIPNTRHTKSIIELSKLNKTILIDISNNVQFKSIKLDNIYYLDRLNQRINHFLFKEINQIEDLSKISKNATSIIEKITKQIKFEDLNLKSCEIAFEGIHQLSEEQVINLKLGKGFEKKEIDIIEYITEGKIGEVILETTPETARVDFKVSSCNVILNKEPILKKGVKVKVTSIKGSKVYVEPLEKEN